MILIINKIRLDYAQMIQSLLGTEYFSSYCLYNNEEIRILHDGLRY